MSTVTETTIQLMRERVLDGTYPLGSRLQEFTLANDLNVSRTPIRDGLRVLASEGLLIYSPNRGYVVRPVRIEDALDAFEVRANLEGLSCRLLAQRGLSRGQAKKFDELLEVGDRVVGVAEWNEAANAAWVAFNTEFHVAIATAPGSRPLEEILLYVRRISRMFDSRVQANAEFSRLVHSHERRRRSQGEHRKIVDVMKAGDAIRVEALMREHIYVGRDVLQKGYDGHFLTERADDAAGTAPKPQSRKIRRGRVKVSPA